MPPLVLTLELDDASQQWLDDLRRRHFPPERLVVGAHVTMFHALPGESEARVRAAVAAALRPAFEVQVSGVRFLGTGVAYDLRSADALALRAQIADSCQGLLTRQDGQPWRPHVTVQNKVAAERARTTYEDLSAAFTPWTAEAVGVALWRYLGGPWEPVTRWDLPRRQA